MNFNETHVQQILSLIVYTHDWFLNINEHELWFIVPLFMTKLLDFELDDFLKEKTWHNEANIHKYYMEYVLHGVCSDFVKMLTWLNYTWNEL